LIDKLGVKPGARVAVLGIEDEEFRAQLRARTEDWSETARAQCDVVLLGVASMAGLTKIPKAASSIKSNGGLWIVYPKGRKDITEAQVIEAGLAAGLVDNKVVSFSPTHTGLRFVFRVVDR
jgi:hypothetical protein